MSDYEIADRKDSRALTEFLHKEGQFLLPIVSLIETAQGAIDEVIDVAGRSTIEAVLHLSAQEVAGRNIPSKCSHDVKETEPCSAAVCKTNFRTKAHRPLISRKIPPAVRSRGQTGGVTLGFF